MAKIKYKFNPESLSYDEINVGLKKQLLKMLPPVFALGVGSILVYFIFAIFVDSPKERMLRRENNILISQMKWMGDRLDLMNKVLDDIAYRDDNIYRTIFETKRIDENVREAGFGGVNRYDKYKGYNHSEMLMKTAEKLDYVANKLNIQSKSFEEVEDLAKNKKQMLRSIPAIQPVMNKDLTRLSSFFGWRIDPIYKTKKFHEGIDFTAPTGTDIYSPGDGKVVLIKKSNRGYGNQVVIDHGYSYKTRYAHLSKISVKKGQKVSRGDVIGLVGNTGKSVGPHLHYEVLKNGSQINPINFFFQDLNPEEYDKMIKLSSQGGQSLD